MPRGRLVIPSMLRESDDFLDKMRKRIRKNRWCGLVEETSDGDWWLCTHPMGCQHQHFVEIQRTNRKVEYVGVYGLNKPGEHDELIEKLMGMSLPEIVDYCQGVLDAHLGKSEGMGL